MNNLQLATTEKFGELDCNFYRDINYNVLMTREQIGSALEYSEPQKAIDKIHTRHKDRLDKFSITTTLVGKTGQEYMTTFYSEKGIMEICRWSRQPKADAFMDFTWDIMSNLFFNKNQQIEQIDNSPILLEIDKLKSELSSIKYLITPQHAIKQFTKWRTKTNNKINLMMDYFGKSYKEILSNLYIELEDTYELDLNECKSDYCLQTGITNCYPLDVIENNKDLRDMFDLLINSILEKCGLCDNQEVNKRKTIFDDIV